MANTVTVLSYANTFGDMMVTVNAISTEYNNLGKNTYQKDTGTLYLNDPTLSLQCNNAIVAGNLSLTGATSFLSVANSVIVTNNIASGNVVATTLLITGNANFTSTTNNIQFKNHINVTNNVFTNNAIVNGALIVSGNSKLNSLGVGTAASGTIGEILATGSVVSSFSDDNLKIRLGNIENALEKLLAINGFYYTPSEIGKSLGYPDERSIGVSAQEVQRILPEVVKPAPIDNQYLTVMYERLIPLIIEAIKELNAKLDKLVD